MTSKNKHPKGSNHAGHKASYKDSSGANAARKARRNEQNEARHQANLALLRDAGIIDRREYTKSRVVQNDRNLMLTAPRGAKVTATDGERLKFSDLLAKITTTRQETPSQRVARARREGRIK